MNLLPKPKKITEKGGQLLLCHSMYIVISKEISDNGIYAAKRLQEAILQETGLLLRLSVGETRDGDFSLRITETLSEQAYEITINENGVQILGGDGAGVLYGVETFCQILQQYGGALPCMQIMDAPDMPNRGYYFDQTRGRILKLEELKKIADRMSLYKLNQLQLYVEHTYLFRDFSEMWRDQTPITAEEIRELDSYCRERHIELVPSLASFGHLCTLLSTKTYGDLCEMEDSWKEPFSFWNRMRYHTINVSDGRSLPLIKKMIAEYMQLFSSDKFNICADETFCLGKYKSKELAKECGIHRLYIDYVKELAQFLVENGKIPMFWGDIIWNSPELMKELPETMVCLNWGYAPEQREDETRAIAQTGAMQYLCPGVCGWNQWANLIENSYKNITRMCNYAAKYHGIGVLNTDWGDFGHINDPAFSIPGMIYGAVFSWNKDEIPFTELNRMISHIEYGDTTGNYVSYLAEICGHSVFQWREAVLYYENQCLKHELEEGEDLFRNVNHASVDTASAALRSLYKKLLESTKTMPENKKQMQLLSVTLQGIGIWNAIGLLAESREKTRSFDLKKGLELAEKLEYWFMAYKENWRSTGKEGDLHHIAEIVFWYADWLRHK